MPDRKVIMELVDRSLAHYRVLGQLGKGGMGEVFLAEDQRLGRRVALKVLRPDLTGEPRILERFQREARSIASLNHPNIVTIYSVEEAEGLHFLVLELIDGETLAARLAAGGPMPLDEVLAIALPLTEALEAAHAHGIVHRDLKPRNIMLGHDGRVKVLDFGIALPARVDEPEDDATETGLTKTGGIIGTASYMSPEQIQERPVDQRSDLFSLGVVLYEMATGQRPFQATGQMATLASILRDTPPPPSILAPELPDLFDEVVNLCLAKEPFLRYRGARELRKDLLRLASGADVRLSIDNFRMTAESLRLLSLLSLLPEGMAREDIPALLPESGAEAASVLRRIGLAFDQGTRLRVLAPIRECVQRSHPPRQADLDRTVDHYLALARIGDELGGVGRGEAADRLRAELGNLEPMILAGLQRADPIPAIHSALAYAEAVRCLGIGGLAILGCARRAARMISHAKLEADCVRKLGDIDLHRAQYEQARERYGQGREIYRRAGHLHGEATCTAHLADIALLQGDPRAALSLGEKALELMRRIGSRLAEANCLFTLGEAARMISEPARAEALLKEALLRFQQVGTTAGVANCLVSLGKMRHEIATAE